MRRRAVIVTLCAALAAGSPAASPGACTAEAPWGSCPAADAGLGPSDDVRMLQSRSRVTQSAVIEEETGKVEEDEDAPYRSWWANHQALLASMKGDCQNSKNAGEVDVKELEEIRRAEEMEIATEANKTRRAAAAALAAGTLAPKPKRGQLALVEETWSASCMDTSTGLVDYYGDGCAEYRNSPHWCSPPGAYNTMMFKKETMCCACGGGTTKASEKDLWAIHDLLLSGWRAVYTPDNETATKESARNAAFSLAKMLRYIHPVKSCRDEMPSSTGYATKLSYVKSVAAKALSCIGVTASSFQIHDYKHNTWHPATARDRIVDEKGCDKKLDYDNNGELDGKKNNCLNGKAQPEGVVACRGTGRGRACALWVALHAMALEAEVLEKRGGTHNAGWNFLNAVATLTSTGALYCKGCTMHTRTSLLPIIKHMGLPSISGP